jgi:hypothetical protein
MPNPILAAEGWIECAEQLPPEGEVVLTRIQDEHGPRNQQKLKRQGRLWFYEDGVYVYYTPTLWMPLARPRQETEGDEG